MSSVTSSAPLSLIWHGTWQASGVNSNGYQRYDCVSHTVTSPTTRTDLYFAVTEIASGGAEPNPSTGQTTWKLLLAGGTIAASDGSVVYHDAEGNNVLVQAAADRILEVVDGMPQFVQRDPAPVATFEGYKLPTTNSSTFVSSANAFWISGDRVFGSGTMQEGFISAASQYTGRSEKEAFTPLLFAPRDDEAQLPIGKIFHGYRCVFAIGKDDKSKVYGLGLKAGRFGDGDSSVTAYVYDAFQKIEFFEDNSINIETILSKDAGSNASYSTRDTDNDDDAVRDQNAIVYFIQEVVDVGGVDTGGNVYISAGSTLADAGLAGNMTRDGTVRQLTGFDEPIIGATWYNFGVYFWSKRKVYGLGQNITVTAGAAVAVVPTVRELGSFTSDIVDFYRDTIGEVSAAITLADGTAYYYNYKPTERARTTTLFEQLPVIDGKLYRKVAVANQARTAVAVMDDNSVYIHGRYYQSASQLTVSTMMELELPFDLEARDVFCDIHAHIFIITTDGNVIANARSSNSSVIEVTAYRQDFSFNSGMITLSSDPGWVGRAERYIEYFASGLGAKSIQTEDGYVYTSNTIGGTVDQDDRSAGEVIVDALRPIGVNFQHQVLYSSNTTNTVTTSSYDDNECNAGTGIISRATTPTFSIRVNGSMVQRPTLRSYQVT